MLLARACGAWGIVLAVAASAPAAQETPGAASKPATQTAAGETWLRVSADEVNLRSRPDANSVPVVRVPHDTVLRAAGRDDYGWYRVRPPEGVFSFVAREYVDRRGPTEGIVSVRSGTLRVRVGSLVQDVDPLQAEVQTLLERGASVQIVGELGDWLKIMPPTGVYVYVAAQHVEPIADQVAAGLRTIHTPASQPARLATATTRPAAEGPDLTGVWGQRLVAVEAFIEREARKPLAERSWSDALARLEPIATQREEPMVARLAEAWSTQLGQRTAEQEAVRAADEVQARSARVDGQQEREARRIERARRAATRPAFEARGVLRRSDALGPRDGKRWYKLLDPLTQRVAAYVEMQAEAEVDPEKLMDQYVGVRGVRRSDPALGADVVTATEIVVLGPEGPATQAATRPARQTP